MAGEGPISAAIGVTLLALIAAPWFLLAVSRRPRRRWYALLMLSTLLACLIYLPTNGRPSFLPRALFVDDWIIMLATLGIHLLVLFVYGLIEPRRKNSE